MRKAAYFQMLPEERIDLEGDEFNDAVRLEAVHRNVSLPMKLPEALKMGLFSSYNTPAESVTFFELRIPAQYGDAKSTGIAYATLEKAQAALQGAFALRFEKYKGSKWVIEQGGEFSVAAVQVGTQAPAVVFKKVVEYEIDEEAFKKVVQDCVDDQCKLRQERYNTQVLLTKRKEYLRLADDNEEIAKAFWSRTETAPWPASPEQSI